MPNPYVDGIQNGNKIIDIQDVGLRESLGTASTYDVPESGDASDNEVVKGDDTRLGNIKGNNTVLTTDKTPFLIRQTLNPTGFSGYVREKLVGASYAWNNRFNNGNFPSASAYGWRTSNATITTGVGSIKFTASAQNGYIVNNHDDFATADTFGTSGHVLLITCMVKTASATTGVQFASWSNPVSSGTTSANTVASTSWQMLALFIKTPSGGATACNIALTDTRSSGWDVIEAKDFKIHDLTLAFGSTIADYLYSLANNGGITKLRDMGCPIDKYTPYGYGLYSVKTSGKKIVGKNLFDGTPSVSNKFLGNNGEEISASGWRISQYMLIKASTTYTVIYNGNLSGAYICWYDNAKTFIASALYGSGSSLSCTVSANAKYLRISYYITTTNIQVAEGASTTFEPYAPVTYSLGNDELRGKFDLVNSEIVASGDVKESNGEILRGWKEIDLGDLTWGYSSGAAIFYANLTDDSPSPKQGGYDAVCAKYTCYIGSYSGQSDKSFTLNNTSWESIKRIWIKDSAYTDATAFTTAVTGLKFVYPLATPTTEQSTPFADPMSMVGATTEEYIDTRDIPCPVGAERQYMGESNDVIPIPSSPMSDGKRVLTSYKSGDEEQLVWEGGISHLRLKVEWGNVASGTVYSFNLTSAIPKITPDTICSISIMCAKGSGASVWDARAKYNYRGSSDGKSIVLQYECAYTQDSAFSIVDVLYYPTI